MKKTASILLVAVALCLTGCAAPLFTKSQSVVPITNAVQVVSVVTNDAGAVVPVATNTAHVVRYITNDVYEVASPVVGYVQTAQGVANTVATVAPPAAPVVSAINAVLGVGLALLGLFARVKTKLAEKQTASLEKATTMLRAVVSGVEVANSPQVKEAISEHASVLGVTSALDEVVQTVVTNLSPRK